MTSVSFSRNDEPNLVMENKFTQPVRQRLVARDTPWVHRPDQHPPDISPCAGRRVGLIFTAGQRHD